MAQVLTVASLVALAGWLGWRYSERLSERRHQPAGSAAQPALSETPYDRRTPQLSAQDFLHGATELAFGVVILGLAFFMLMWVIATG